MDARDTILSVNIVEPGLVAAIKKHGKELHKNLKGLVLVHVGYAGKPGRKKDASDFFEEIVCDFNNPDELQRVLQPYTDRLLAVTCRYDSAMESFRKLLPFVPYLSTPTETSLMWASEKSLMRDRLRTYDERLVPKYQYIERNKADDVDALTKDFVFPVIVKPSGLAESLLVTRCDTREALHACLDRTFEVIQDIYIRERRETLPGVLIEEMMQGDMYSVDAYVTQEGAIFCLPPVKVVTAHSIGLPGFYAYMCITPVDLPEAEIQAAFQTSESAIKALNLRSTSAHIELFHTPTGWKVIELAARIGGHREQLYREAYGVDHYYNDLAIRMGMEPSMPGKSISYAACMHVYAEKEGIIESITNVEDAQSLDSVVSMTTCAKPGDAAAFAENGGKVIVEGIFSCKDPELLIKDIAQARAFIQIKVKK